MTRSAAKDKSWRRLCGIDAWALRQQLDQLVWVSGGPGIYAMIDKYPADLPVQPIFDRLLGHYLGRRRGMTLFSRLVPGQYIPPHRDGHDGHCKVRIHVPLSTNPACVFVVGGDAFHMAVGSAYVIDPTEVHSAVNGGASDRVHLIFNAVG